MRRAELHPLGEAGAVTALLPSHTWSEPAAPARGPRCPASCYTPLVPNAAAATLDCKLPIIKTHTKKNPLVPTGDAL